MGVWEQSNSGRRCSRVARPPPWSSTTPKLPRLGRGQRRFPVVATINGYTWRTSVTRMGGEFLLGLNKEVRQGRASRPATRSM